MPRTDRHQRVRMDPESRRASILAAAAAAFNHQPYRAVAIKAIGDAAGASEGLVYKYFSGKAELYAQVVSADLAELNSRLTAVLSAVPEGSPLRLSLEAGIRVYLEYIAEHPLSWAEPLRGGEEPEAALMVRRETRERYVAWVRSRLPERSDERFEYSLWAYYGFLDSACLRWVDRGCPASEKEDLVGAAVGALAGAIGGLN